MLSGENDLTEALAIRRQVFVVEQEIPAELDDDGEDGDAIHVLARVDGRAVATGRAVVSDEGIATLARIAVLPEMRGRNLGKKVVTALESAVADAGAHTAMLHPHEHLEAFYQSLGYQTVGGTHHAGRYRLITMRHGLRAAPERF